jgi:SAM-dependent methyltransferase
MESSGNHEISFNRFGNLVRVPDDVTVPGAIQKYTDEISRCFENNGFTVKDIETSATFGNNEPTYLELMGKVEISRLKNIDKGNFLLLGSVNEKSTEGIISFASKINNHIKPYVVEVDSQPVEIISKKLKEKQNPDSVLVQGDATKLPFRGESMDYVFSNFLFRSIRQEGNLDEVYVSSILSKVFDSLKPGGSFCVVDGPLTNPENNLIPIENPESVKKIFIELAEKSGFVVIKETEVIFSLVKQQRRTRIK